MREIKFRQAIRDTEGNFKHWHYWGYLADKWYGCTLPLGPVEWDERESYQYTGLKDKNGEEIYEGNIGFHYFYMQGHRIGYKGVVEYRSSKYVVQEMGGTCQDLHPGFEVIGNIYENPELLT